MTTNFGASPQDWDVLALVHGLSEDLLPVVSNPNAEISPQSKMASLGKTPSRYNGAHLVAGIKDWTELRASADDIARWRKQPDYGICIQTRNLRALDVDVTDPKVAEEVKHFIDTELGIALPMRYRKDSSKFLYAFYLPGEDQFKLKIKLGDPGIIEFLRTGQQFVAVGQHPSGARYEWKVGDVEGLPEEFPTLNLEDVMTLWEKLAEHFGVEVSASEGKSKAKVLHEAIANDPVASYLLENDWVRSTERDGRMHITCPFEEDHTGPSSDSSTTYFPAHTGGYQFGHFDCKHAHCEDRTDADFLHAIGAPVRDVFAEFEDIEAGEEREEGEAKPSVPSDFDDDESAPPSAEAKKPEKKKRFVVQRASDFAQLKPMSWVIKHVIPKAPLTVVFGDSGVGKTFVVLDIVGAIARGVQWRELRTTQGACAYVCAEGANGMRSRLKAYAAHEGIDLEDLPIGIIADAPNLMQVLDVKELIQSIREFGKVATVVIDTFAQAMAGANENSGEDVGRAIAHCQVIHKYTGAAVILVHHSGKNADKGARGWSGLRGAVDAEIEVTRLGDERMAKVTKLKDGPDGAEFGFKLVPIPVGMDEDGDIIESCAVEEAEVIHRVAPEGKDIVKARILRAINNGGTLAENRVDANTVIETVMESLLPPAEGKKDTRRDKVVNAIMALQETGQIVQKGGWLSLPEAGDATMFD